MSATVGGYDRVHPQAEQDVRVDWWMVTDTPADLPRPWRHIPATPSDEHPRLAAKAPRMMPWTLGLPLARYVVWVDANTQVTCPTFAREAVAAIHDGVAVWKHPERGCIYDEAVASLRLAPAKYAHLPILDQVAAYHREGHPVDGGLYATGTIVWDTRDRRVRRLGADWLAECRQWTYQDQLSFPVVCRRLGVTPGTFPLSQVTFRGGRKLLHNRWLRIHPHLRDR